MGKKSSAGVSPALRRIRIGYVRRGGRPRRPALMTDGWEILHRFAVQNDKSVSMCHSEERSDEESPAFQFLRTARKTGPYGVI